MNNWQWGIVIGGAVALFLIGHQVLWIEGGGPELVEQYDRAVESGNW